VLRILEPIYTATPEARAIYAPEGKILGQGDVFRYPDLGDALDRFGAEGAAALCSGEVPRLVEEYIVSRGGTLSVADFEAYEPIVRAPVGARYRGRELLTNPPPSAGGILVAYSLALLERMEGSGPEEIARAMAAANEARDDDFALSLGQEGFARRFLDDRLGSTTHLAAIDSDGLCASVTCSNGTGSGMVVPGTGFHLNNMLGEEDLNPRGFHQSAPGERISSMMSPTLILEQGMVRAGLGSAGSNRIRSAGAIFVGAWSPVSLGDYCAGSNHVLPTAGGARHSSGLSVQTFLRGIHVINYTEAALKDVSGHVITLANAEDLPAHGEAVRRRFER